MLDISFGKHRADTNWKPEYLTWGELVELLRKVRRTTETMDQYDKMHNVGRGKAKDGPAFVGGFIRGGRRKKENVDSRSLITLDADHADEDFLFAVDLILGGRAYAIYSTHSHRPAKPKYRLVAPADRGMPPDEYAAVSRKLAEQIGMHYFDKTTFDVHRLMYLPSCSKDAEPVLEVAEGDPLEVDGVLDKYDDWRDVMAWPRHPEDKTGPQLISKKAQDPREKNGTIGLFCRAYTIEGGIDEFLEGIYVPGSMPNRYTYTGGTSGNGLEIFPDQELAYSHQDSDPVADGRTYNLFDLVRVHKFGHLDERVKEFTPDAKKPSHVAMEHWAISLPEVKRLAGADFAANFADEDLGDGEDPEDGSWTEKLERHSKTSRLLPTANNVELLLSYGPWKDVLAYDAFGNMEVIRKVLPWRDKLRPNADYEPWLGADDKRMQHWFAKVHEIKGSQTILNAFTEVAHANRFHPIQDFLESATWDGVKRLETVFIDYQGAEDSHYARQVTRKSLLAAVTRIYQPGCKFDEMVVLVGKQGTGKSSLLAKLGGRWFSDSLKSFENKEAGEHLQNGWIFEIGEMQAMKKAEVESVKAFLSKTEDRYRVAYDRQVSEFPRKCVFFGTTNNKEFLVDTTGNRRFWPIDIMKERAKYDQWTHLTNEVVHQIWAEALHYYKQGEGLTLDQQARAEAEVQQDEHFEGDPREGVIRAWLEAPVTDDFDSEPYFRNRVCAAQVWAECLHKRIGDLTKWEARTICGVLRKIPGWAERDNRVTLGDYGKVLVFDRLIPKY